MVKVYCDMCKREIDYNADGVNLDFNHYGVVKFMHGVKDEERQLCLNCAIRVRNWISEQCEREKNGGGVMGFSEKSAVYECVDREHDAWRCRACGYIENSEADGPTENGWHFCPGCGREIIVEAVNPCPFDNDNCMCQFCETPCNNGLNCSDCAHEGKTVHDVLLCTGFDGSMEQYTENWKRKQMAKLGGERE